MSDEKIGESEATNAIRKLKNHKAIVVGDETGTMLK